MLREAVLVLLLVLDSVGSAGDKWSRLLHVYEGISIRPEPCLSCWMDVSDEQWAQIRRWLPPEERHRVGAERGRPWRNARDVLNGVLWVLRTGAPWREIPRRYPPCSTCHRRFQRWQREGVLDRIVRALASTLFRRGALDLTEAFIDGSHAGAKRGVPSWVEPAEAKRPSSWR